MPGSDTPIPWSQIGDAQGVDVRGAWPSMSEQIESVENPMITGGLGAGRGTSETSDFGEGLQE